MAIRAEPITSKTLWERFIQQHARHAYFQSWDWGEAESQSGHAPIRTGLYSGQDLVGVAQSLYIPARRGPFLHVRHGPVLAKDTARLWRAATDALTDIARERRAWFIRISPLIGDTAQHHAMFETLSLKPSPIHAMDAEVCWVLDITAPEEEILSAMRKSTRYEVKRAQKMDVKIEETTDPAGLDAFFSLYTQTSKRHGFVPHAGIRREFEVFAAEDNAVILNGYFQDTLVASAVVVYYGDQAIYRHGASILSKAPVSHAIQWRSIQRAKKRGKKRYNFWGIADTDKKSHPWKGITVFKKGFGGEEVRYIHAHDLPLTLLYAIPKTIETVRRIKKGY